MMRKLKWIASVLLATVIGATGQLVSDEFDDASLDLTKWIPSTPFGNSDITESNGVIQLTNRGIITAVPDFGPSITTCRFQFTGDHNDRLYVTIRSNGSVGGSFGFPLTGLRVGIHPSADTSSVEVGLAQNAGNVSLATSASPFPILQNQYYIASIIDNGETVQVLLDGQLVLSHDTLADDGDRIHITNREYLGVENQIQIDWANIRSTENQLRIHAAVEVEVQTQLFMLYQIQFTDDSATWHNLGEPFIGTGGTMYFFDSTRGSTGNRMYRLVEP